MQKSGRPLTALVINWFFCEGFYISPTCILVLQCLTTCFYILSLQTFASHSYGHSLILYNIFKNLCHYFDLFNQITKELMKPGLISKERNLSF